MQGEDAGLAQGDFMAGTGVGQNNHLCSQSVRTFEAKLRAVAEYPLPSLYRRARDPVASIAEPVRAFPVRVDPGFDALIQEHVQRSDDATTSPLALLPPRVRQRIAAVPPTSTAEARLSSCAAIPSSIIAKVRPRAAKYPASAAGAANSAIPMRRKAGACDRASNSTRTRAAIAPTRPASADKASERGQDRSVLGVVGPPSEGSPAP